MKNVFIKRTGRIIGYILVIGIGVLSAAGLVGAVILFGKGIRSLQGML